MSTVVNAIVESDLRSEICLSILAFLTWGEFHGGVGTMLDGSIAAWLTAGRPDDPQIARAIRKTRAVLSHYIASGGCVPAWVPASLLKALGEPCCARDLAPSSVANLLKEPVSNPLFDSLPTGAPAENVTRTRTTDTNPAPSGHQLKGI